jgi:hypothetical protein
MNLEDALFGELDKEEAMTAVIGNEPVGWKCLHDSELLVYLKERAGQPFVPDEWRIWFKSRGNPDPHHHNVWGAMWNRSIKLGLVKRTGVIRKCTVRSSHARATPEWVAA